MRAGTATEEADTLEKVAARHAGRGKDEVVTGGEVLRAVDAALVAVAHARTALALLVASIPEASLDLTAEAPQRRSRDHAFGRAADPHDGVDAGARDGAADRGGEVAVGDELDAGASGPNIRDQLGVPRP